MSMDVRAVMWCLMRARDLVREPHQWTYGVFARNAAGQPCDWQAIDAVAFDIEGAIHRASRIEPADLAIATLAIARARSANRKHNDDMTHEEVIKTLSDAIIMEEQLCR